MSKSFPSLAQRRLFEDSLVKRQTAMEVLHRAFIFEKELKVLLLKAEQEHQGALYGLWTTDGEPVIHIKQLFKD